MKHLLVVIASLFLVAAPISANLPTPTSHPERWTGAQWAELSPSDRSAFVAGSLMATNAIIASLGIPVPELSVGAIVEQINAWYADDDHDNKRALVDVLDSIIDP